MSTNMFYDELRKISEKQQTLASTRNASNHEKQLIDKVNQWESVSIANIKSHTRKVVETVQKTFRESNDRFTKKMNDLSVELNRVRTAGTSDMTKINQLLGLLSKCEAECQKMSSLKVTEEISTSIPLITLHIPKQMEFSRTMEDQPRSSQPIDMHQSTPGNSSEFGMSRWTEKQPVSIPQSLSSKQSSSSGSSSVAFGLDAQMNPTLKSVLRRLSTLPPMDKYGPMSGKCDEQTTQMETFLKREFGFENIPGEYIVHGVKKFRLKNPPEKQDPRRIIYFPRQQKEAFAMSMEEIQKWQRSYKVYAPSAKSNITKTFLEKALQGGSENGPEAFLMKFVVRISTCPILMEFDARVKDRRLDEDWPNRIKLVSVTGVDFACRIHDMDDVKTYITNWRDIFRIDPRTQRFETQGGRDLILRNPPQKTKLNIELLHEDLMTMARIRLQACDREGVEIVVETGIGLGIFSGVILGIDEMVRKVSAVVMRKVLEQDGSIFQSIKAVVFALPIFPSRSDPNGFDTSVFKAFKEEFSKANYRGPIPVIIIDQDMHRLAVEMAKEGYQVSELNPADSHGVFGEYWQNRGPAVEEKLALTTLGLLVQHHLINKMVLDRKTYQFI